MASSRRNESKRTIKANGYKVQKSLQYKSKRRKGFKKTNKRDKVMGFGKTKKKHQNWALKRIKILYAYRDIKEDEVYDYEDKPSITGKELKEMFKQKYKWLN